jgi:hypothetical protein
MGVSYSGSISDIPPAGPVVQPGAGLADIKALIASCQGDFSSAQEAYSILLVPYTTLRGRVDLYTSGVISWQQLVSDYNDISGALSPLISDARTTLLNASAAVVTAIAYEQLYYAQTSANTIGSVAPSLLTNANVSSAAKTTIQSILDQLSSLQSNLSSAFLNYRHSVYETATAQGAFDQAQINYDIAVCQNAKGQLSDSDLDAADSALKAAQETLTSAQSSENSYKATLDSAISAINTAYTTIKNLGAGVASPSTPPIEDVGAQVTALEAAYEAQKSYFSQGSVTREAAAASTITLPSSTATISMIQLMYLLGQAQVMSIEVSRRSALSAAIVNAFHFQAASMGLQSVATDIGGLQVLAQEIRQIVNNYNSQINQLNNQSLSAAEDEYSFFAQNLDIINQVIDTANTAYENNDAAMVALLDAASQISQATLDAIFSESLSETLSESFLLNAPSAPTGTLPDVPLATTYTPIAGLAPFHFISITPSTTLDDMNAAFASLLDRIAPVLPQIETALALFPGAPSDLSLTPTIGYATYPMPSIVPNQSTISQLSQIFSAYNIQEASTESVMKTQDAIEADLLLRLLVLCGQGLNITSSGALASLSGGAGAGSAAAAAALTEIGASSIFHDTIEAIFSSASLLAGLQMAGTTPEIMAKLAETKMTLSEYLEAQATQAGAELDATTRAELANALLQQLALLVTTPGALQAYAASIIQGMPELAGLAEEDKNAVLSGLVSVLQSVVISGMVLIGLSQGLTAAGLATLAFGTETTSVSALAAQFTALGIPMQRATELASMIAGDTASSQILENLQYDATTRAEILALVAANRGNISLATGVPGGPAFLAAILHDLSLKGLVLPSDTTSPDFISQLIAQLQAKATPEQASAIQAAFLPAAAAVPTGAVSTLDLFMQAARQTESALRGILTTPVSAGATVMGVLPTSILDQFAAQFRALSPSIQQTLLAQVANNPVLATLPGMTNEQTASLMLATRLGAVTPAEAGSLIALVRAQAAAAAQNLPFTLSNLETSLITNLFTPTAEERRILEEALRAEIQRPHVAPSTLSPQTLDSISAAFRQYFLSAGDRNRAVQAVQAFAQTTQNITNFPQVAAKFLTSPAMIILRTYSLRTRLAQDRSMQQDITMTG